MYLEYRNQILMIMKKTLNTLILCLISFLLVLSVNAQDEDFNKLVKKIYEGDVNGLKELIESGVDVDTKGSSGVTALLLASSYEKGYEVVKYLVSAGADINFVGERDGRTPVIWAAGTSYETTAFLVSSGADLNIEGLDGVTAFIAAVFGVFGGDSFRMLDLLIENGADINLAKKGGEGVYGYSALSYAVRNLRADLTEYLISNGAEVNHQTSDGDTPLLIAASEESAELVGMLLKSGADKTIKNNKGETALDIAISKENQALTDLLK